MNAVVKQLAAPTEADPVLDDLLAEFGNQLHAGDGGGIEAFIVAHPERAETLRRMLPAIQVLANLELSAGAVEGPDGAGLEAPVLGELGDYRLIREIGRGGMGVVYEAEQMSLRRRVALKILPFAAALDAKQLQRFKNEAMAAAHMHHQNIVPVHAVGTERGVHYYAMQFIEGQTLAALIGELRRMSGLETEKRTGPAEPASELAKELASGKWAAAHGHAAEPQPTGPYPSRPTAEGVVQTDLDRQAGQSEETLHSPAADVRTERSTRTPAFFRTVAGLGIQAAAALEHAHELGVIHRDIKPANLLVDGRGNLWITDFGLAHCQSQAGLTMTGDLLGTLRYMSPEQALAKRILVDQRTDVYSLGATLYELLTLEPVFAGSDRQELLRQMAFEEPRPPRRLNKAIPAELETIVLKAVEKNPADRYASAQELADDLERFLKDEPIRARGPSLLHKARKWSQRHRAVVATAAAAAALAVLLLLLGLMISNRAITQQQAQTGDALKQARRAERDGQDKLWRSYRDQARALRFGGQAGQRFDSLKALADAARIARTLDAGEEDILSLRNEAVACLALADLRFERTLLENVPHYYWAAFDPDFRYFACSDLAGKVTIRRVADGHATAHLPPPSARPKWVGLEFSPDGRRLAVGYDLPKGQEFRIWEFVEGSAVRPVALKGARAYFDFSKDSSLIAAGSGDGTIGVYDAATGLELKRLVPGVRVSRPVFRPDGRQLAATGPSGEVLILDLDTGAEIARYDDHSQPVGTVAWRGDGRLLAVPCDDQRIYVWDTIEGRLQSVLEGHTALAIGVMFSHGGDFLMSRCWDNTTRLWDPVSGRLLVVQPATHFVDLRRDDRQVGLMRFNPQGDMSLELGELAAGGECRTLHHGLVGNRTPRPASWGPRNVAFSPNGRLLASGHLDGVRLWDLETFGEVAHLRTGHVGNLLFHPGGDLFVYGERGLHRWPMRAKSEAGNVLQVGPPQALDAPAEILNMYLYADDKCRYLAAVDQPRGQVIVLDLDEPGRKLILPYAKVSAGGVSPDGRWATTRTSSSMRVWDLSNGKPVWDAPAPGVFSPDSGWVVSNWHEDNTIRFFEAGSGRPGAIVPRPTAKARFLRFSPEGQSLLAQGTPPMLLHPSTMKQLATLKAPFDNIQDDARYSPDATRLAVVTRNHTVHLWDLRALRRQLAEIGLDWDRPPYPPVDPKGDAKPVRVEVQSEL